MSSALDPRIASATVLAGDADLVGDEIVRLTTVRLGDKVVALPAPIPGVPEYVAAAASEKRAEHLRPQLAEGLDESGEIPYQPDGAKVLDFYAAAGTAVTSAIAGVEAYANHHITRAAAGAATIGYGGQTYTREALWNLPLEERLGDLLPELTGQSSPKQETWWSGFRRVQGVAALTRHGVTEPYKRSGLAGEESLVQRYCDGEYLGAASSMLSIFEHFTPGYVPSAVTARDFD